MDFTKVQGAGNDFILVEAGSIEQDWPQIAVAVCDRHYGIGGDGLLLLLPSDVADFQMRVFNADGSEAETCGNGMRCLARYVFEKGRISPDTEEITIETVAGINRVKLEKRGGKLVEIWANMGRPEFSADRIPVAIKPEGGSIVDIKSMLNYKVTVGGMDLALNCISMGNPHAVYFCQEPVVEFPLSKIGPRVESLSIFPNRVNFEVARVLSRQHLEARVWERGVGETLACGSGACAIAVAARVHGYIGNKVDIKLPGGLLQVEWNGRGELLLSGPAETVFTGKWPD